MGSAFLNMPINRYVFLHFKNLEHEQGLLDNGGTGLYTNCTFRELLPDLGIIWGPNWKFGRRDGGLNRDTPTFPIECLRSVYAWRNPFLIGSLQTYNIVIHNGDWV